MAKCNLSVACLNSLRFFLRIYFPANRLEALWKRIDAWRDEAEVTHNISAPVLPLFLDHDPGRKTLIQFVSDANLFVHL